ncbi:MAG: alanine racemase, partial [Oscillospiraceae bacterium]
EEIFLAIVALIVSQISAHCDKIFSDDILSITRSRKHSYDNPKAVIYMLFAVTNLDALRGNADIIKKKYGTNLIAVLKHNAYSSGMAACARALADSTLALAVSSLREAGILLDSGLNAERIMVLDPILPSELNDSLAKVILPIDCLEIMRALDNIYINKRLRVQLRIDLCKSGIGLREEVFDEALTRVFQSPGMTLYGIFAHVPSLYRCEDIRGMSARFERLCQKTRLIFPAAVCHGDQRLDELRAAAI